MAAGKVEVLHVVHRFDVDKCDKYVNIKEGDMGRVDGPGKLYRVAIIEVFKKNEIMTLSPQQEDIVNILPPEIPLRD